jgi:hypothetical protein
MIINKEILRSFVIREAIVRRCCWVGFWLFSLSALFVIPKYVFPRVASATSIWISLLLCPVLFISWCIGLMGLFVWFFEGPARLTSRLRRKVRSDRRLLRSVSKNGEPGYRDDNATEHLLKN